MEEPLQEIEFISLAEDIGPGKYSKLCNALGYSYAVSQSHIVKHLNNVNEALEELLIKWNNNQGDSTQTRSILASKLYEIRLHDLGDRLSEGKYLPNQQDSQDHKKTPVHTSPGMAAHGGKADGLLFQLAEDIDKDIYSKKISEALTVKRCREKLEKKYRDQLCKIQMTPWNHNDYAEFEDMHTVVTVVKKDAHENEMRTKKILQGSVAEIFSTKVKGRLPNRILLSAQAGRGKTTAVAKMAHDWVHRERGSALELLPLLFVVKFRNTSQRTTIGEAIKSQLLSDVDDLTPEGLESFIRKNQGICHIILDGLDEYAGISSSNRSLGSNIVSVIRCEEFPECRVLVTTRPHLENFFDQDDLPRVYTKMWIEGFSRESSCEYINKFFASTCNLCKRQSLKDYLDEQPLIDELVKTPLFCLMICLLWDEGLLDSGTTTQTELLDRVNVFLTHHANARSNSRVEITPKKLRKIISRLGEVALTGLLDDAKKLVFTPHDFRKVPSTLHRARELGILFITTIPTTGLPRSHKTTSTTIEFYHKLVQEHSAGKYLAAKTKNCMLRLKISKLDTLLRNIKSNIGDYENLIRFAAGTDDSLCIRIMEALLSNRFLDESERYRILLDCSSETKGTQGNVHMLVQRCVTAQSIILKSPTVYTVVGMLNLPMELKRKVRTVKFEGSTLSTCVTSGLWSCLNSFFMLDTLIISDSHLSFPPSPPKLLSVTKLSAERVTLRSYDGLLSSLPGLKEVDITIGDANTEDISEIHTILRRHLTGHDLTRINPHFFPPEGNVSSMLEKRMRALGLLITECQAILSGVVFGLEDAVIDVVQSPSRLMSASPYVEQFFRSLNSDKRALNIETLKIKDCQLSTEMTEKLWSCLRSFTALNQLSISDSSLSFPSSPPELPSVTKLSAERVTSQSYEGLLSSLPGLRDVDITIDDAERDIPQITAGLRRTGGQQLTHIRLKAPPSLPSEKNCVSRETMRGLGSLIREQTKNLQWLGLSGMKSLDEEDFVEVVESSTYLKALDSLQLKSIDDEAFNYDRHSDVQCLYFTRFDHEKLPEGLVRRMEEVLPRTTTTSSGQTVSPSQRSAAFTSVDFPPKDASAATGEVAISKVRVTSIDEQHEDDGTTKTSSGKTVSSFQRSAACTSGDISLKDAAAASDDVSISIARVLSIDEQHEDEETTEKSLGKTVSVSPRPSSSIPVAIPIQDASAVAGEVSTPRAIALCIDEQHEYEDKDEGSATGNFGALGGELSSKSHGLTLHIPPGALEEDQKISLGVLSEIPNGLTLKDDEVLVSHGFQCYPSGLRFNKPAKLIIPHCAIVTAPNKIQSVLYSWNQSGTLKPLPHSSDIVCSVQERWLEVSISRFSGGYFALIWDLLFLKGILLSCMSFLPRVLPFNRQPVLEVRFVKMLHDKNWNDGDESYQPVNDEDDYVVFRRSTLTVSCQLGETSPEIDSRQAIQHSDLSSKTKEIKYFPLNLTERSDETLVTLSLVQTTTQMIKFNTHFQGITESPKPAASTSVDIAPQNASAAAGEVSTSRDRALSFEEQHEDEDDEGQMIESVHHIPQPSASQDETQVQNLESRNDLSDDAGMIRLEKHGIEVRIPPNEAYRTNVITVEPIHDIPPDLALMLKETEAIITFGLRMSPSNATFDNPVQVTMPHCGIFTKPEAAEVVTYYRKSASESFTAIPSTNGSLRCVVRHHDLDVYMHHFSEIWIVALIKWVFIGKRVICTPYIPVSTPRYANHVLFVHVRNGNIPEKVFRGYVAPLDGEQFLLKWRSGGLRVTCKESTPMEEEVTTLQESEIRHLTEHKVMFTVDTRTTDVNEVILNFILKQSTKKQIIVTMFLEGKSETSQGKTDSASPRPSASTSVDIHPQGAAAAAGSGEVYTSKAKPIEESREHDFDDLLKTVAKKIHKDTDIDSLGKALGFDAAEIARYIKTNEKYQTVTYMGTLSMLRDWRNRTTRSKEREQLKKALIAIGHNHLADDLLNDGMASPSAVTRDPIQPKGEGIPNNPKPDSTDEDDTKGENQTKSHGSEEERLLGQPRKSKKKTNRQTDSTDEDDTRGDNQSKSQGSEEEDLLGPPRKSKKKTNRQTDSTDEDDIGGDNKSRSHGSEDDGLLRPPRETKKKRQAVRLTLSMKMTQKGTTNQRAMVPKMTVCLDLQRRQNRRQTVRRHVVAVPCVR